MEQWEVGSNDASAAVTLSWGPGGCCTARCSGQPLTLRDPQLREMHTQCKISRQPSGLISEESFGSVDSRLLLTAFLHPGFIMGLTAVIPALPPVRVRAMTSSKHLHPGDEGNICRKDFFYPCCSSMRLERH